MRLWIVVALVLVTTTSAFAQATSTFNGRVVDADNAVLPGVTVTATNAATGVARTTVTNDQGVYFMPGLEPGTFQIKTELAGFTDAVRQSVVLGLNATLTLDFKLAVAGLAETLTVTGQAPLIEVTQSKMATTIQATELQNLPMVTRNISGMLQLLPGASPAAPLHRTKTNSGTVSFAGSTGGNVTSVVDGADNRDNHYSGPLLTFTTEGMEQFQLSSSQFNAVDGRTGGAAVSLVTKSGTNVMHGSAFSYFRDKSLTAKDYFTKQNKAEKNPFNRQQYGGSFGGPIVRNKWFIFGAIEQQSEETGTSVSDSVLTQWNALVTATNRGQIPQGYVNPNPTNFISQPGGLRMLSIKSNLQLNNQQSVMFRYAGQNEDKTAVTYPGTGTNDNSQRADMNIEAFSAVGQHSWVIGNAGLNQITGQMNDLNYLSDMTNLAGERYASNFPKINIFAPRLDFPSMTTGAGGDAGTIADRQVYQIRDDFSLLKGGHSLKTGFNFNYLNNLGILNGNEHFATISFFDDPLAILNNVGGRYPQGFQTPGIVDSWQQANGGAVNGQGSWADTLMDVQQYSTWFQDDWRVRPNLTLNLGVRYDLDINLMDQKNFALNATRIALEKIGRPEGGSPQTPNTDISPRVGMAWDISGDGTRVVRGGWGLYFDQYNTAAAAGDITSQARRPLNALKTLINTNFGVGQLPTYRFGIDPLPAQPTEGGSLPSGSDGQWIATDMVDPRSHQFHAGYAHTLAANTTLSVDFTHIEGLNEKRRSQINPILNGQRRLANDFRQAFGDPNYLGNVYILTGRNKSRYDALTFLLQRRMPRMTIQTHYTLAKASAYGGSTGNRSGSPEPQVWDQPFGPGEWGPASVDERHRFVFTGVIEGPVGIQLSPVVQAASARPYNRNAGRDLNADGRNTDRYVDPVTGQQDSVNMARGDNTFVLDLRTTKFVGFGGDRKLGIFVEFFNLANTANFGSTYNGNGRSALFQTPTGYVPGIGYPRQVQLGARFLF